MAKEKQPIRNEDGDALMNCMTVIAGKRASATGRVLVGHNEDDRGNLVVRHSWMPAMDWPEGTLLPAEAGCAAVPQAAHTYGYYWTQVRTDSTGYTASDSFYNEKGVLIVSNSMGTSREPVDGQGCLREGGLAYNLRRILAERSASARGGVRLLIELVEKWGYRPSGRAYTIADKDEAFMIQLVHGHRYIGARVPDDHIVLMPNYYTFHTLEDCPEMFYSPDLVEHAVEMGWHVPAKAGDFMDFDFTRAYQAPEEYQGARNAMRQIHGQSIALGREWDPEREGLPFSIPAERKLDEGLMQQILSSHYEGTPDLNELFGPGRSPHDTPNTRYICTGTTIESMICAFDEDRELTTVYTAYGRPCQLPYVPMHPLMGIVPALEEQGDAVERMRGHLQPEPGALWYREDLWHRFHSAETAMEMTYEQSHGPALARARELLLQAVESSRGAVEQARALRKQGRAQEAREKLLAADEAFLRYAAEDVEKTAEALNRVEIEPTEAWEKGAEEIRIVFRSPQAPVEDTLVLGLTHTHVRLKYGRAVQNSLRALGKDRYEARFLTEPFQDYASYAGFFEFFLGGRNEAGQAYYGRCFLNFTG